MAADPQTAEQIRAEWSFLGRRVLVVSPFPPARDGIGRYAAQLLDELPDRSFRRLALPGGYGDRVRRLWGGLRPLWILRDAAGTDDVLIMWHPDYYVQGGFGGRMASYGTFWLLTRLRRTTFVVHEPDHERPVEIGRRGKLEFAVQEFVRRRLWRGVSSLVFHTEWERRRFVTRFPGGRRRVDRVLTHGTFYTTSVTVSKADARRRLGLPADRGVLVCIGFLSPDRPDKGYDRAIRAVGRAGRDDLELHVVGSPIRSSPEVDAYVAELRRLAGETPNVTLREQYVSDEEFDLWLIAADALLAPYRTSSSSGVVVRAHLIGVQLIASSVGGLADQLEDGDIRFDTDDELVECIRRLQWSPPA